MFVAVDTPGKGTAMKSHTNSDENLMREFVGGPLDGQRAQLGPGPSLPHELRLPSRNEQNRGEIYRLTPDGRYFFAGYGAAGRTRGDGQQEEAYEADLRVALYALRPALEALDAVFRKHGGYAPITLGGWELFRMDG
jgi:hypothetical protein